LGPFETIKKVPGYFIIGVISIILITFGIYEIVGKYNFKLCIGLIIGFQGAGYFTLFKILQYEVKRKK